MSFAGIKKSYVCKEYSLRTDRQGRRCGGQCMSWYQEPLTNTRAACRDFGARIDRQKARLMWMVEDMGVDKFRELVGQYMGDVTLRTGVHPKVP